MLVKIEDETKEVSAKKAKNVGELLNLLNMNREEVVVKVNGSIVSEEESLKEGDKVEIIKVVFGG